MHAAMLTTPHSGARPHAAVHGSPPVAVPAPLRSQHHRVLPTPPGAPTTCRALHLPCKLLGLMFPPAAEPSPFLRAVCTPPALPRCAEALHIIYPRVCAVPSTRGFSFKARISPLLCGTPPAPCPAGGARGIHLPPGSRAMGANQGMGASPTQPTGDVQIFCLWK